MRTFTSLAFVCSLSAALLVACGDDDGGDGTEGGGSSGTGGGAGTSGEVDAGGSDAGRGGSGQPPIAGQSGTDDCYSPTQNLDTAYEPGSVGCPCSDDDEDVCVLPVALICREGRWQAVEDGPCEPRGDQGRGCGARLGDTCGPDEYCAYEPGSYCGAADATAICKARPTACDLNLEPVCGCDGKTYSNACAANAAGTGVVDLGECE